MLPTAVATTFVVTLKRGMLSNFVTVPNMDSATPTEASCSEPASHDIHDSAQMPAAMHIAHMNVKRVTLTKMSNICCINQRSEWIRSKCCKGLSHMSLLVAADL